MKSINRTILAALACAAISLGLGTIAAPAYAHSSGFGIEVGPNGINIGIDIRHHHRRHHDNCGGCGGGYQYNQPAPYIDIVVYETVGGYQDEWRTDCCGRQYRTGRQIWVEQQVPRNVRAFWDPRSNAYWYFDSYGNRQVYN